MIAFVLKEKTKSLNQSFRGDWRARAGTAKRQRDKAMKACPPWANGPLLTVRLTRVSPGRLDDDAVPAALKHVRDGVAARLRVDDASPLVRWEYQQELGAPAVIVQAWSHADTESSKRDTLIDAALKELRQEATAKRKRTATVIADARARLRMVCEPGRGQIRAHKANYTPPRTSKEARAPGVIERTIGAEVLRTIQQQEKAPAFARAMEAAREAEETFAPAPCTPSAPCGHCMDCVGTLP